MELELDSSNSNCPLGHSLSESELDSSITSSSQLDSHPQSPPSIDRNHDHNHNNYDDDHDQSSDYVSDQLNSLAIDDDKAVADNNGGDEGGCEEERETIEQQFRENEEEIGENGEEIGENEEEIGENENGVEIEDVNKNEELSKNEEENKNEEEREKESSRKRSYYRFPVRPDAEDCAFYLKTGVCKFGMNCKFNHPPNHKKFQGAKVKVKEEGVDSATNKEKDETVDKEQIDCKYFDRPGGCKFGKACKFIHRRTNSTLKLNFMGLPIRPGEKECPFYMRNGSCKYGANCRFNHPDPTTIGVADALPRYSNGGSIFSPNVSRSTLAPWSPTTLNESPPYVPLMFSPTQSAPPQPEWNAYQAPVYLPEKNMHIPSTYALNKGILERPEQMQGDEFPERPGQPECSYFLKTGNCKYKSACKFHHPKSAAAQSPSFRLSDLGLPLRPGENVCSHYNRYGICKYGPACKYDHPINHAYSSELTISVVDETPVLGDSMVNNQTMAAGS